MGNLTKEIRPKIWYDYMKYLAKKVGFDKKIYYNLIKKLHDTDFVWSNEMDQNRAGDGTYKRYYFFKDLGLSSDSDFPYPCSVFEMLVSFAIRMGDDYLGYSSSGDNGYGLIFLMFLKNLGLIEGEKPIENTDEIERNLYFWMERRYENDGFGSLFCLPKSVKSYNKMEIWKQMNVFLTENDVENLDDILKFL